MRFDDKYDVRKRNQMIFISLLALALVVLVVVAIVVAVQGNKDEDSSSVVDMGRAEEIYIDDYYSGRRLIPNYDIPLNRYDMDKFLKASATGIIQYEGAVAGIDVSDYQKVIDWAKVKESGVDFAIIRVGYRGFTEGGLMLDDGFATNMERAIANGIDVGVYFFSQAVTEEEAREEAAYVLDKVKDYELKYPIFFDWENITHYAETAVPRTINATAEQVTACTKAFCDAIIEGGYKAGYYFNKDLGYSMYDLELLQDYDVWYAEYQDVPSFYYNFDIWQYTESGSIAGIEVEVDLNLSFKTYE